MTGSATLVFEHGTLETGEVTNLVPKRGAEINCSCGATFATKPEAVDHLAEEGVIDPEKIDR